METEGDQCPEISIPCDDSYPLSHSDKFLSPI